MKPKQKAFTLIELLIVIVILGVLMSTLLPKITGAQAKARDTARKVDLTNISKALELYYLENNSYPSTDNHGACLDITSKGADPYEEISVFMKASGLPQDPRPAESPVFCDGSPELIKGGYYYKSLDIDTSSDMSYILCTDIELSENANSKTGSNIKSDTKTDISSILEFINVTDPDTIYCLAG